MQSDIPAALEPAAGGATDAPSHLTPTLDYTPPGLISLLFTDIGMLGDLQDMEEEGRGEDEKEEGRIAIFFCDHNRLALIRNILFPSSLFFSSSCVLSVFSFLLSSSSSLPLSCYLSRFFLVSFSNVIFFFFLPPSFLSSSPCRCGRYIDTVSCQR